MSTLDLTALEMAMLVMIGLTIASGLVPVVLRGADPVRGARVALAVLAALLFQAHVLIDGPNPRHWPLYAAGFLTLVAVAAHWFRAAPTHPNDGAGGGDANDST